MPKRKPETLKIEGDGYKATFRVDVIDAAIDHLEAAMQEYLGRELRAELEALLEETPITLNYCVGFRHFAGGLLYGVGLNVPGRYDGRITCQLAREHIVPWVQQWVNWVKNDTPETLDT